MSNQSHTRAKQRQAAILKRAALLYPDIASRLIVWRNRRRHFLAGLPAHVAVLGVREGASRRALLFSPSWHQLDCLTRGDDGRR